MTFVLLANAALEWQAWTIDFNKNLVAACPLEGLVRSVLTCRQDTRVEFQTDVVDGTRRKSETDHERGSDGTVWLWDPVWTVSIRFVNHCLRNHKDREGPANLVQWEARHTCER